MTGMADASTLATAISAWSDGYQVSTDNKLGSAWITALNSNTSNTTFQTAWGRGLTATVAAQGAYMQQLVFSRDTTNSEWDGTSWSTIYLPTSAVAAGTNLSSVATGAITVSDTTNQAKYGWTASGNTFSAGNEIVADLNLGASWYFPKEGTAAATAETDATGDRWSKDNKITGFAGQGTNAAGAMPAGTACFTDIALTGASALVAGASALAVALAF